MSNSPEVVAFVSAENKLVELIMSPAGDRADTGKIIWSVSTKQDYFNIHNSETPENYLDSTPEIRDAYFSAMKKVEMGILELRSLLDNFLAKTPDFDPNGDTAIWFEGLEVTFGQGWL